jgi:hypothetical protein
MSPFGAYFMGVQLGAAVRRRNSNPLNVFSLWPRSLSTLTADIHIMSRNCSMINGDNIEVVTEQCFMWFTVRVPRRAGPLAQAPAPQYSVAGADIYDDHYVRRGRPAALPRLYSDIGQRFLQIRAVSGIAHWRIVWNVITQQVQQSYNLMEQSPCLEALRPQLVKEFFAF